MVTTIMFRQTPGVILRSGGFSRWVRFYSLRLEAIHVFID
jgi:hypothetical protein